MRESEWREAQDRTYSGTDRDGELYRDQAAGLREIYSPSPWKGEIFRVDDVVRRAEKIGFLRGLKYAGIGFVLMALGLLALAWFAC